MSVKEKDIVRACLDYLSYNRLGKFWRSNTGAVVLEYKWRKRFIRYGRVGSGDITGLIRRKVIADNGIREIGQRVEIEVKTEKGKQTLSQKEFQQEIEENGGLYLLVRGVDDLIAAGL